MERLVTNRRRNQQRRNTEILDNCVHLKEMVGQRGGTDKFPGILTFPDLCGTQQERDKGCVPQFYVCAL